MTEVEVFHAVPAASETAIVAFTGWARDDGRHDLFKVLQPLPFAKLLMLDPSRHWYNTGIPGVGSTVAEIAARIEEEVGKLGATRVIAIGSSMGGYGAILFGCLLGAERVIALAPQTLVDPSLQPRFLPPDIELEVPDLEPVLREAGETKVELVAGWDDHEDIFHAQRVAGLDSVRVLALPGKTHYLARELSTEGELLPLVDALIEGRTPRHCLVDPKLDPDVESRLAVAFMAVSKAEWEPAVEAIAPVADRYEDWAAPHSALGQAFAGMRDFEGADAAFSKVMALNPTWDLTRRKLIDVLLELGRLERAERVIRDGLALHPDSAPGHLLLARCLLRQKRLPEARAAALTASELYAKPANPAEDFLGTMVDPPQRI